MNLRLRGLRWMAPACLAAAPLLPVLAMPGHIDMVLGAGKVHEECFRLETGRRVRYNFSMDRPGEFNLHYHKGNDVFYPVRSERVSEQKGDFVAATAEEYCLMWTGGKGGDTRLGYEFIVVEPGLTKP
jgi:hypothetical protein